MSNLKIRLNSTPMENAFMEMMAENLDDTDLHPKVGIFRYSPTIEALGTGGMKN